jgi:hypothetical protein
MVRDGDMFGDGVNIAVRMEKLAQPGFVCLSAPAHAYVAKVSPLRFDDLGAQPVKSLATPVQAYLVHCSDHPLSRAQPPVHRRSEFNLGRRFHAILNRALLEVTRPEGLTLLEPASSPPFTMLPTSTNGACPSGLALTSRALSGWSGTLSFEASLAGHGANAAARYGYSASPLRCGIR